MVSYCLPRLVTTMRLEDQGDSREAGSYHASDPIVELLASRCLALVPSNRDNDHQLLSPDCCLAVTVSIPQLYLHLKAVLSAFRLNVPF